MEGLGAPVVGAVEEGYFSVFDGEAGEAAGAGVFGYESADEGAEGGGGEGEEGAEVGHDLVEVVEVVDGAFAGEDVPLGGVLVGFLEEWRGWGYLVEAWRGVSAIFSSVFLDYLCECF